MRKLTAPEIVRQSKTPQTVVVTASGFSAHPTERFIPLGQPRAGFFWPADVLAQAGVAAAHDVEAGCLGFGLYSERQLIFQCYAVMASGHVEPLSEAHGEDGVVRVVREYHDRFRGIPVEELSARLERELASHDWHCSYSDAPGVCSAGERHMREVIRPLLLAVPPEVGRTLWQRYASNDPYTDE